MDTTTHHHRHSAGTAPGDRNWEITLAFGLTEFDAPGVPFDSFLGIVGRIRVALLCAAVLLACSALSHEALAQPTEVLLSNGNPPASARLLLVNVAQRHVAQEFTTGPHPGGYDVYAVAVRTEDSAGKHNIGLQGMIRTRRSESAGPWHVMMPHRQVGPTLTRSRPISDYNWSWFMSSEPIHLEPNETYFFELACSWGCFAATNRVGLGLTESDDEDHASLPGWTMADGFMIQNSRFNRWWGDMVVGGDGFFHPNPQGPALRLEIRGEPREIAGLTATGAVMPQLSASDAQVREGPNARLAFPVTLSSASTSRVTVIFETEDGTAIAGSDYVPMSGRLVFAPGQTERTITVPILHDARKENAETVMLRLSGAMGAQLADSEATGTIVNAAPRAREWMARNEPSLPRQAAGAAAVRTDGTSIIFEQMEPLSPGAVETQDALAANGEEPAWEDAGHSLVGTWSSRFGEMPVPPVTPTDGVDTGASRAPAPNSRQTPGIQTPGGQTLAERMRDGGRLVHVSAYDAQAPILIDWGRGVRAEFAEVGDGTNLHHGVPTPTTGENPEQDVRRTSATGSNAHQAVNGQPPSNDDGMAHVESGLSRMSPALRLALGEPVSQWSTNGCGDR